MQIRFCPNCKTERSIDEVICKGDIDGSPCEWQLSDVPITESGTARPALPISITDQPNIEQRTCQNGHPVSPGDLICPICHVELKEEGSSEISETIIGNWRIQKNISIPGSVRECYITIRDSDEREGVCTLYCEGYEPDPSVYDVLSRMPHEHIPEIIETGRWNDRYYEVTEHITGGNFNNLEIDPDNLPMINRIVSEVGRALDEFNKVGLRHRDIRPHTVLIRNKEPLDLVIDGFGSARLSDYDLDIVSPLETTWYMAPEAIAGGVAAASDWWSLGMLLLEKVTRGACFEGVNKEIFLIHAVTHGVSIPSNIHPDVHLLLRGLLARDRTKRWLWNEVHRWLNGEPVQAPENASISEEIKGPSITLGGVQYYRLSSYTLAAADTSNWVAARNQFLRGEVISWAEEVGADQKIISGLRTLHRKDIDNDFRLSCALKILNSDIPLIHYGKIVTPGWLLENPLEGYALITSGIPDILAQMEMELWLLGLKNRAEAVRIRAKNHDIELNEEELQIHLLSTSKARLSALWEEKRKLYPDTDYAGLATIINRQQITDEDLIILLSASISQYRSVEDIVNEAVEIAREYDVKSFNKQEAAQQLQRNNRREIFRLIDDRTENFARSGLSRLDSWVDQYRLEHRMYLSRALVLLAIPLESWKQPEKQEYISRIISFFEQKVTLSIKRGPLARMTISKSSPRIDLIELGTERVPAQPILDRILDRSEQVINLDPAIISNNSILENRLRNLQNHATLYRRDTGIDGLYLGFPFLVTQPTSSKVRPRIAPVLLWPIKLTLAIGQRGMAALVFDHDREEVRVNPALEGFLGPENTRKWQDVAEQILHDTVKTADVMDTFASLAAVKQRTLTTLPSSDVNVPQGHGELVCSAVLFHVTFMGQAIVEDLRQLKNRAAAAPGTALESCLRIGTETDGSNSADDQAVDEVERYLTVECDPTQEKAVLHARKYPGLLIEGPPGTGKSQTIVNIIADAIGCGKSLLLVCQKRAALEVVYKRLVAEDLANRIVTINDAQKDRASIIMSIRNQLENTRVKKPSDLQLLNDRASTAARIESLQEEINQHHTAIYQIDSQCGLSYRDIISDLVTLESGNYPIIELRALRPILSSYDHSRLAIIEDVCAPLTRYWIYSEYEDSPFSMLKSFGWDEATLDDFKADYQRFVAEEHNRLTILKNHKTRFDLIDVEPTQHWIKKYASKLLNMRVDLRHNLSRWLSKYYVKAQHQIIGDNIQDALIAILGRIESFSSKDHDAHLFPAIVSMDQATINYWIAIASNVMKPITLLGRLNINRYLQRRKLMRFLTQIKEMPTDARMAEFLRATILEASLRPIRISLIEVVKELGDEWDHIDRLSINDIKNHVRELLKALSEVALLAEVISVSPRYAETESAALADNSEAFINLFRELESAIVRHEARSRSLAAVAALETWFQEETLADVKSHITSNNSNSIFINSVRDKLHTLAPYLQFRVRSKHLSDDGWRVLKILKGVRGALQKLPVDDIDKEMRRIIKREVRLAWKERLEQASPALLMERTELENKIRLLAEADKKMKTLNQRALKQNIELERIGDKRKWEEITRLHGARAIRLREFIDRGADIGLLQLRPVWLMNPDVASRVLPLKPNIFDIVIYDEASQIPVEYALPTLFRGQLVIVSGDEKQLPPTAFFTSKVESDEAEIFEGDLLDDDATEDEREEAEELINRSEIQNCSDLLVLARAVLPKAMLKIHYRSSYRELIEFSNASFYANQLNIPVRHPDIKVREAKPIETRRINGAYEHQTNPEEARAVVDILANHWSIPENKRQSIGVVTFNRKQADLIEELLEERSVSDTEFKDAYINESNRTENGQEMGFFVKNVENVQGDERDVIVFSSTFGRNAQGTFRRIFGVLGQEGGERRLNVAISRARHKVILVTSMPIEDISDMLSLHRSPVRPRDYLQGYMQYAQMVSDGNLDVAQHLLTQMTNGDEAVRVGKQESNDGFKIMVADFIRELGWEPVLSDDGSVFGIDCAIEDPRTGLYGIGIECDGPNHPILSDARAREIWRPRVLAQSIPYIHRVSSYDWYHNRIAEQSRLEQAITATLT